MFKEIDRCRVCGSKGLTLTVSLGEQYIVDFVGENTKEGLKGPLELVMCDTSQGGCGLVQLKHTFNHDTLYRQYWYRSGISATMIKALRGIVEKAENLVPLSSGDIVLDIGANDGTLLRQYKEKTITKVGYEPSNLWKLAEQKDCKIIHDYFSFRSFDKEFHGKNAKIITSIAMFYDLEEPNKFVSDIKKCLAIDGIWIIQMNYLGSMVDNNTFDNISHEHLEYYSLMCLEFLLNKHGLEAFDVALNEVNGGSFRIYIRHRRSGLRNPRGSKERLLNLRKYERTNKLQDKETYLKFAERIEMIRRNLQKLLESEKSKGKKIFIYGASTRGFVVLQFAGINDKLIANATDKNPDKWGKYIIGTGIRIIPLETYREEKPDYLLILPYHFIDEIMEQEKPFLQHGGKFIVAIPAVKVIP